MIFLNKISFLLAFLTIFSYNSILCLEDSSVLIIPFKGKSLQKEEDPEDYIEPYQYEEREGQIPYVEPVYNSSKFITNWFYNGMYHLTNIGSKSIQSYINVGNSKLSIERCNVNRVYSPATMTDKTHYKPLNSDTYSSSEKKIGNDIFTFYGDFKFLKNIKIGEQKGNGLDFYFNKDDMDYALCGNLGLNLDTSLDKTNLITQLKKKNYINKYVWTLKYQNEEDGIIILGTEPHFYEKDSFKEEKYCRIKAIPNQSPDTAWSFNMDKVFINHKNKSQIINLSQNKVDFLIDRGLIIGTDEYKKKIDEIVFDDLISKGVCNRELKRFKDEEKSTNDEYYIYYCNEDKFIGNKYTVDKTYYNTFPSLEFFIQECNKTFSLTKEHLFYTLSNRVYFLVVFKNSETQNNIWKLGEPFFSHFQFTFDQDQKTVGFYSAYYQNNNLNVNNNSNNGGHLALYIIIVIILVILLIGLAFYLGKKLNQNRKKRANELNDDDFDYSSNKKLNTNEALGV